MRSLSGHHSRSGGRWCLLLGLVALAALLALALPGVARADGYVHLRTFGGPGSGDGQLATPELVCTDNDGYVYVADHSNNRVEKFAPDGAYVLAWGSFGTTSGLFDQPSGICYEPSDDLICVCDYGNNRVQEFTRGGVWVRTVLSGTVSHPLGICWDGNHLVVADAGNGRIVQCYADGSVPYAWGSAQFASGFPYGIAYDPQSGDYYVADEANAWVVQFDSSDNFVKYIGAGTFSAINNPYGDAVDSNGNLLVCGYWTHTVYKFSPAGTLLGSLPSAGTVNAFSGPMGVSVDAQGHVYVVDLGNNDVQVWAYDTTPPVVSCDYDHEWHSTPYTVTFTATDDLSGVWQISQDGWAPDGIGAGPLDMPLTIHVPAPAGTHANDGVSTFTYSVGDQVLNWTPTRTLVLKVDTRPPVTTVSGLPSDWVNHDVTLHFSAGDRGAGVAQTQYSPDGGSDWFNVPDSGDVTVSTEGDNAVQFYSWDAAVPNANFEAVHTGHVLIDKTAPTAVALANASVKRGALATLRFELADNVSPTCDVKLLIKTAKGKLVKTVPVLGEPTTPTPTATFSRFPCRLAKGKYKWICQATDLAGNTALSGAKKLTVK